MVFYNISMIPVKCREWDSNPTVLSRIYLLKLPLDPI